MADKLAVYREILRNVGAERLASLDERRPERVLIDDVWTDGVRTVLSEGLWNFATRTEMLDYDTDSDVVIGYDYAFTKPLDTVRTAGVSQDGMFNDGFELWKDEGNFIYANIPTIYVEYISDDSQYGMNIGRWPQMFAGAVAAYIAFQIAKPVSNSDSIRNENWQLYKRLLKDAKALDATEDRVRRPPVGRLVKARFANRISSTDRGIT